MPRLTPVHYRKLARVFEKVGFVLDRQEGDHLIFVKSGILRPVVIPMYSTVPVFIIQNNLKTAGIGRDDYLKILKQ